MRECAIFDMDGTLANVSSMRHFVRVCPKDFNKFHSESVNVPPNPEVVALAHDFHNQGIDIVIVTARRAMWRNHTAMWLALNGVPSVALFMRGNKDHRSDVHIKRDILHQIRKSWKVVWAVDDNPSIIKLWKDEDIPVTIVEGWEV